VEGSWRGGRAVEGA